MKILELKNIVAKIKTQPMASSTAWKELRKD